MKIGKKFTKILNMAWNPQFLDEHQVSYHFGKLWPYPLQGFIPNWASCINQWEIGLTKMKNFTTKLLRFNTYKNLVLKIDHYGHYDAANKKKNCEHLIRSQFFWDFFLKKCPDQNLTKGKIVLELLKYVKSAIRKFWPIRSLHCGHVTLNGGLLWLVEIF